MSNVTAYLLGAVTVFAIALIMYVRRGWRDALQIVLLEQRCKTLKEEVSLHEVASFAAQKEIAKLHVEIVKLRFKTGTENGLRNGSDLKVAVVPTFDQKTRDLVALALNNPEDKEATTAAMIVCKRLRKEYGV